MFSNFEITDIRLRRPSSGTFIGELCFLINQSIWPLADRLDCSQNTGFMWLLGGTNRLRLFVAPNRANLGYTVILGYSVIVSFIVF